MGAKRVTSLRIYPVKSLGGLPVASARLDPGGFVGDRRWALVDDAGELVTAREVHQLLRLTATVADAQAIRITDRADGASIVVAAPIRGEPVPVGVSRQPFLTPADSAVNGWLSRRVGTPVRLVWQEDPRSRAINPARGGLPGEHLSLADAGPLLLTSETSLAQLGAWIAADTGLPDVSGIDPADMSDTAATGPTGAARPPAAAGSPAAAALDMVRFRPNVVIDGDQPFAEDGWAGVQIGDVWFRTTMTCDRCVMTTLDPDTLAGGKEPIRTLARHRRWDGKVWFGIRLVRTGGGDTVRVGDTVLA